MISCRNKIFLIVLCCVESCRSARSLILRELLQDLVSVYYGSLIFSCTYCFCFVFNCIIIPLNWGIPCGFNTRKVIIHFIMNNMILFVWFGMEFPNIPIKLPAVIASSQHYVEYNKYKITTGNPLTAVPMASMTVLPICPCFYRG